MYIGFTELCFTNRDGLSFIPMPQHFPPMAASCVECSTKVEEVSHALLPVRCPFFRIGKKPVEFLPTECFVLLMHVNVSQIEQGYFHKEVHPRTIQQTSDIDKDTSAIESQQIGEGHQGSAPGKEAVFEVLWHLFNAPISG